MELAPASGSDPPRCLIIAAVLTGWVPYVEHPFRILKCVFGFRKVCYRGIAKNLNRLQVSFALVNLYMKRRTLMRRVAA